MPDVRTVGELEAVLAAVLDAYLPSDELLWPVRIQTVRGKVAVTAVIPAGDTTRVPPDPED